MQALLIGYGVFLLLIAAFGAAAVYHAKKFGFPGDKTRLATLVFLAVVVIIIVVSVVMISGTDFSGEAV